MRLIAGMSLILLFLIAPQVNYCQQQSLDGENYLSALDSIVGEKILKELTLNKRPQWTITVVGSPAFAKDEILFGIAKYENGEIKLIKITPKACSIYRQRESLLKQRVKDPMSRISVSRTLVTNSECPQLNQLAKSWETLTLKFIPDNQLMLDATNYIVKVEGLYGESRTINFAAGDVKIDRSSFLMILIGDTLTGCFGLTNNF